MKRICLAALATLALGSAAHAQLFFDDTLPVTSKAAIAALSPEARARGLARTDLSGTLAKLAPTAQTEVIGETIGRPVAVLSPASRQVAELARARPDHRPRMVALMERAGLRFGDLPPFDLSRDATEAVLYHDERLMQEVARRLAARGDRDPWLSDQIAKYAALRAQRSGEDGTSPLDPSDRPVGSGLVQPEPVGDGLPAPDPQNLPAVIDWVLENNGCRASEAMIFRAIEERTDLWTANQAIRFWTEAADFAEGYTADVRGDGVIYTKLKGPICSSAVARATTAPAVQALVEGAVAYECQGRGGTMKSDGIIQRDLDGDGQGDLVLDHGHITCRGTTPLSCGVRVCATHFYMSRGGKLGEVLVLQGAVGGVSTGAPPMITMMGHSLATTDYVWTGSGFAPR